MSLLVSFVLQTNNIPRLQSQLLSERSDTDWGRLRCEKIEIQNFLIDQKVFRLEISVDD